MAQARVIARRGERGFTVIEVLIAMCISVIGLAGVLGLERAGARATGYSRHATEAAILAEDRLERLRTTPSASLANGSDVVDSRGLVGNGTYTRAWTVSWTGDLADLAVTVSWFENGSEGHAVTYRTRRNR